MDKETKYQKIFIDNFYTMFPNLKKEFDDYLISDQYHDPQRDAKKYYRKMCGLSFFILKLWEEKKSDELKKILDFIESQIGIHSETDDSIEVLIFEGVMNVIKGSNSDNNTQKFKEFERLLGQKSINLCRKNQVLWNSLDREPKSLGNMIRFLKEHK